MESQVPAITPPDHHTKHTEISTLLVSYYPLTYSQVHISYTTVSVCFDPVGSLEIV